MAREGRPMRARNKAFSVRVDEEELQMLRQLSRLTGIGMAGLIRQAVRAKYKEVTGHLFPFELWEEGSK
jgi:predicted DNA-binding protein